MIQKLSGRYRRHSACILMATFMLQAVPMLSRAGGAGKKRFATYVPLPGAARPDGTSKVRKPVDLLPGEDKKEGVSQQGEVLGSGRKDDDEFIGGPSQPEMASFKPVGTDNMVDLFTGNFSYNIPLLDVGGYPVNIFYNSGSGMDEDASWVGLGWNINPGSVTRNMRGIPDDFDGTEKLAQTQLMKPNVTWGVNLAGDIELVGIKGLLNVEVGANTGISFNNYLGPAINQGVKGGIILSLPVASEKKTTDSLSLKIGASAELGSRSGFALSPNASLTAFSMSAGNTLTAGVSLSTSYNSRSGIKSMQISEQVSASRKSSEQEFGKRKKSRDGGYTSSASATLFANTIDFAKPSYIPAMRMPVTNTAWSGHFQIGGSLWGLQASAEAEVYQQKAEVSDEDRLLLKPMVGYLHYDAAKADPQAVMDFTRLNDKEVTSGTPVISAPQYTYDVFSIQGEGTGGAIRFYRHDMGYVRDNFTMSRDKNVSVGVDVGVPGQIGVNFSLIKTPTTIGEWGYGNSLRSLAGFGGASGTGEKVYLRNPGEVSVLQQGLYDNIGGTDLVRYKLGGTGDAPVLMPQLERFQMDGYAVGAAGNVSLAAPVTKERAKRSQVVSFLTAHEASEVGLDKAIRSYKIQAVEKDGFLEADEMPREDSYRLPHHISQINVNETDGKRYVYGLPVYNITQQDYTFSVGENDAADPDRVIYTPAEAETSSPHLQKSSKGKDGYYQKTVTPPYAHSYLLTGLLSPDYVDVDNNGITENDLGNAVKFNYTRIGDDVNAAVYKWRTPYGKPLVKEANFNDGNLTEAKDDKALFTYGERESWYTHSIESKTMVAIFTLGDRDDGKGVTDSAGGINVNDNSLKRLERIDLYNKADVKANGTGPGGAKPVKTVNFEYDYSLCPGVPGNKNGGGKLTLTKVYFTYNGKVRASKDQYVFNYGGTEENPGYKNSSTDPWGTYKPKEKNPGSMRNRDYPYALQPVTKSGQLYKDVNGYAGAWNLKKILLPSGGQLEVGYESDDFAYVQDKRAMDMMPIIGFGHSEGTSAPDASAFSPKLYDVAVRPALSGPKVVVTDNEYVLIQVPDACASSQEAQLKYLSGVSQLCFRLAVQMPKGVEYITCYADVEEFGLLGTTAPDNSKVWARLKPVGDYGPLSLTVLEYLREQLPGQAYKGYDVSDDAGIKQMASMLEGMMAALSCAFTKPVDCFREQGLAQSVLPGQSFVRLNDPDGFKYGGGLRVKTVKMYDNWKEMTKSTANSQAGLYTSMYGNQYDYTTTETFNGLSRTISSGVASYEPSVGGEENPFHTILKVANTLPLGPTSYGAIEMPVLDAFFPSPAVGYSKVTVRSLNTNPDPATLKLRSATGKQVHQFYTAKEYPVYYSHTTIDQAADKQEHRSSVLAFFNKYAFDARALTQGFLVATNDMHGKPKSQAAFADTDADNPVSYTEYFYKNTGTKGLSETFDFAYPVKGGTDGAIIPGNMGIDIELMTDTREFSVKGTSLEVQAQIDLFPVIAPAWLPFIWPVTGETESTYRAVTTTKVINYHAVADKVIAIDKGSQVSTENLVYDAETGNVLVTRTNNEFDKPIYNVTYPAWWAYGGMGLAYKNIDAVYSGVAFIDGKLSVDGVTQDEIKKTFESGDELYITFNGFAGSCAENYPDQAGEKLVWAFDKKKDMTSLNTDHDFVFLDKNGYPYNRTGVSFRIVRSGHRNMLGESLASVTLMENPLEADPNHPATGWKKLKNFIGYTSPAIPGDKIINASAVEYKEKWAADNEVIRKYKWTDDCPASEVEYCDGYLDKSINPYVTGLAGNFKAYKNWVFYGTRQQENLVASLSTNIAADGHLKDFKRFWTYQANPSDNNFGQWAPTGASAPTKWVFTAESKRFDSRGLELESMDALENYTSAQYGYKKSMPVAVTANSRYREMFFEGFEDRLYDDALNDAATNNCAEKHVSIGLDGSVVPMTGGVRPHSGTRMIKVDANNTATGKFNVENSDNSNLFNLPLQTLARQSLYEQGGLINLFAKSPASTPDPEQTTSPNWGNGSNGRLFDIRIQMVDVVPDGQTVYGYQYNMTQYVEMPSEGVYYLKHQVQKEINDINDLSPELPFMNVKITAVANGDIIPMTPYGTTVETNGGLGYQSIAIRTYKVCLKKGIYKIESECGKGVFEIETPSEISFGPSPPYSYPRDGFLLWFDGLNLVSYKSTQALESCPYTLPLAASEPMLNPVFTIPSGKKMFFSGWVSQGAGTGAKVQLKNGGVTVASLSPSGPVIEGWQKIEGDFTVPDDYKDIEISLIKGGSATAYFDDLRIHPYNANMKSYVYDPVSLRLRATLDENNYASFYEYDEEGTLVRTKAETQEGIKTITETRSSKQKKIQAPVQ